MAEKRGTFTNHAGHVQRVAPAVEPAFDAWSEGEVLLRLQALESPPDVLVDSPEELPYILRVTS